MEESWRVRPGGRHRGPGWTRATSRRPSGGGTARSPTPPGIAGVVCALILLVLLIGPYQTHLQDFWIIPLALGMLGLIVYGTVKRRNDWRK